MSFGFAVLLACPAALAVILALSFLRRPSVVGPRRRPTLILAAHPDDCVIVAGGYAIEARAAGQRVQVAYLTCGAASPHLERSSIRKRESLAAWALVAVSPEDVTFFDLPEHPVGGPSSWTAADCEGARAWIEDLLREMPLGGVVVLPAAGEAHVDHRGLRTIALEAWKRSERSDLVFLEVPEYNDYLSVVQSPEKVLVMMMTRIPGLSRMVAGRRPAWTGFASGGPYWTLPPSESRLAQRKDMLRAFASEDGNLLVHLFGSFERYRPVSDPSRGLAESSPRGYLMMGGKRRGATTFLAMVVMAEVAALVAAGLAHLGVNWMSGVASMRVAIWLAAGAAFVLGARPRTPVDTRVFYWAVSAGTIAGTVT